MKVSFFKYVPVGFAHVWEKAGWVATGILNDTHHAHYSVCMEWKGDGEPICPPMEVAA